MGETRKCFLCGVPLTEHPMLWVVVRTAVPEWKERKVCGPCWRRVEAQTAPMVCADGEWYTVRLRAEQLEFEEVKKVT